MYSKLSEIHLKSTNHYIGYIVEKNDRITNLISLDKHGNECGLIYFKNTEIDKIFSNSKRISFY